MSYYHLISCKDLPWSEGFPSSYHWFQDTQTEPPNLIAKPKVPAVTTAVQQEENLGTEPANKRRRVKSPRRSGRLRNRRVIYCDDSDSEE
jgi:hypothetical protein